MASGTNEAIGIDRGLVRQTEFAFSDAYRRLLTVHGIDRDGVERKYVVKATGFWAYRLRRRIEVLSTEVSR